MNMVYDEFNALTRGLRSTPESKYPGTVTGAGTDASAIHGRPGAQVALLQSPILPVASSAYTQRKKFRGLPVDKPHTRIPTISWYIRSYYLIPHSPNPTRNLRPLEESQDSPTAYRTSRASSGQQQPKLQPPLRPLANHALSILHFELPSSRFVLSFRVFREGMSFVSGAS